MAYQYAIYVEKVAEAGKNQYPLPLYTNVWQNYMDGDIAFPVTVAGGGGPGEYPSGGAVSNVLNIWQAFAPSLNFIAPDIYFNDYTASCAKYRHLDQPLFIPEQRRDEYGARRIWKAFGCYQAIGTSPFGIIHTSGCILCSKLSYSQVSGRKRKYNLGCNIELLLSLSLSQYLILP